MLITYEEDQYKNLASKENERLFKDKFQQDVIYNIILRRRDDEKKKQKRKKRQP
jgi:hypothetical protein